MLAVYYIWQERNIRIFQNDFRTKETVFKIIVDSVRHKFLGLNIKRSVETEKASVIWKIPMKNCHDTCCRSQSSYDNGINGVT